MEKTYFIVKYSCSNQSDMKEYKLHFTHESDANEFADCLISQGKDEYAATYAEIIKVSEKPVRKIRKKITIIEEALEG